MNEAAVAAGDPRKVESIFLTCISCGKVEEIHVFPERLIIKKMYWECHACQNREGDNGKHL